MMWAHPTHVVYNNQHDNQHPQQVSQLGYSCLHTYLLAPLPLAPLRRSVSSWLLYVPPLPLQLFIIHYYFFFISAWVGTSDG